MCSSASKRGKYRQEVTVGEFTTRSVPFIIIPMKEGERRIEVKASVKESFLNDGIMKMLRVVVREPVLLFVCQKICSLSVPCKTKMCFLTEYKQASKNC